MKFLSFALLTLFSFSVFAQDQAAQTPQQAPTESLKITPYLRLKMVNDSVARKNSIDFDTSGITIEKKFGENFSVLVNPEFKRGTALFGAASTNDSLDFFLNQGYFTINDLTRSYGDYGLKLTAGLYQNPNYNVEQYYQPYRFIYKGLEDRILTNGKLDLGVMLSKNFFEDVLRVYLSYITGVSNVGEFFVDPSNDNINAGGSRLNVSVFPFLKMGDALKELSLNFNLKALGRANARSWYSFLLGYKYDRLATSLEYLKSYSSNASTYVGAASFGASYDVYGPLQAIARWDYTDLSATTGKRTHDDLYLIGANTKWFSGKLQAALTYDQDYNPSTHKAVAKRVMIATQCKF
jgi:hypothetical protein